MILSDLSQHGTVCFGGEDWWYQNRAHCDMQIMLQIADHAPVLYINSIMMQKPKISEGTMFWRRVRRKARSMLRNLKHVRNDFWVFSPVTAPVHHLPWARRINTEVLTAQVRFTLRRIGMTKPLVWVNCPAACDTAIRLDRCALVYQRTDRYEDYPNVDADQITRYDQRLKRHAEVTFYSNRKLFEAERRDCRKAIYVGHGVDYEMFSTAESDPQVPAEIANVPSPIAGFFGDLEEHTCDMAMIEEVVGLLPDIHFVFVGQRTVDCSRLARNGNVTLIDKQPYEEIPHYGKRFDVCLMPWKQNRWIDACNPIKLKEYLALGKPIVSTPFSELQHYQGLIHIANSPTEFAQRIRQALEDDSPEAIEARRDAVATKSWQAVTETILEQVDAIPSRCESVALEGAG